LSLFHDEIAGQSFDLFLAPLLKDLSARVSSDVEFQLFDFSVLNKLSPLAKETSEAVEFICPRKALKQFVNAEIPTSNWLIRASCLLTACASPSTCNLLNSFAAEIPFSISLPVSGFYLTFLRVDESKGLRPARRNSTSSAGLGRRNSR